MRCSGVLFDLFGTLIAPFRRREHMAALQACAQHLGLSFDECHRYWSETFARRVRGEFVSVADNFPWIARQLGRRPTPQALTQAEAVYERFTAESLVPLVFSRRCLPRLSLAVMAARFIRWRARARPAPEPPVRSVPQFATEVQDDPLAMGAPRSTR